MATVLVPVDSLSAVYEDFDVMGAPNPQLVLTASGQVSTGIRGIHFERHFAMILPNRVTPTGKVTIVTENHPDGQTIEIKNVMPLTTAPDAISNVASGAQNVLKIVISGKSDGKSGVGPVGHGPGPVLLPVKVRSLVQETFEITIPDQVVADLPDVDIEYDPSFFTLVNAGHKSKDLFWELKPLVTGYSSVVVRTSHDGQNWWNVKAFYIRSFLPFGPGIPCELKDEITAATGNPEKANGGVGLVEPFLAFLYTGIRIVQAQVPGAQLYECSLTSSTHGMVNDVADLNVLNVVFQLPGNKTGFLNSAGWGEWKPLVIINSPWMEDIVIEWPIDVDAQEAQALKDKSYPGPFYGFVLRHPLGPTPEEPYYIFTMGNWKYVFVGVKSKKVFEEIVNTATGPVKTT
ncbi:hypothetical protein H072_7204 [Dactylellina haptotyla CBS 200.50]|uniref:Uncharacterized protein n=1 Tax=Dactylellina haptotyla (strain CBS 200.50) TaxID=1284197 RepID=S8AD35_DACHA|nr:hypothetical protein H072_7204 [Dactylellina haptotyla CBS 200.50]